MKIVYDEYVPMTQSERQYSKTLLLAIFFAVIAFWAVFHIKDGKPNIQLSNNCIQHTEK